MNIDDTVVLATVVASKSAKPGQDFFPLTVDYIEKTYAAGKIPGSFFKREGRPSELEILTCRLIDRPIRPLFPEGFYNEVQVIVHVLSLNPEVQADIAAMIGTSAALAISGIPFDGPIGAARVGYVNGEYVLNPGKTQLLDSKLDLVVAGTEAAVLMVESEADQLSEEIMLGAVVFGHEQGNIAIAAINELVRDAGKPEWDWKAPAKDEAFIAKLNALAEAPLRAAYQIRSKQARTQACREAYANVHGRAEGRRRRVRRRQGRSACCSTSKRASCAARSWPASRASTAATRAPCARSRSATACCRAPTARRCSRAARRRRWWWPRWAPSATRSASTRWPASSPTTSCCTTTCRPSPPAKPAASARPKRREIGHGRLAKRALLAALPSKEDFPYTMRVVSEITESNGSSSMASVCGGCLALMDAGVPMKAHVAGIAMGLIKDGNRFAVLTDILGDEDHLGDMDFKVAGTTGGITALQMDIKIQGITKEIMQVALAQAKEARLHILGKMQEAMGEAKAEVSQFAPRLYTMKINPEKIRDVIGKGGAVIRALTEETGCVIDIGEDGTITIASTDADKAEFAKKRIDRDHGRSRGRQGLRRPGHQDPGLRRADQPAAGQGRPAAHQPDRAPARREGHRLPRGRPDRQGQGARDRREGPRQAVDEGAARAARRHGRRARAPAAPRVRRPSAPRLRRPWRPRRPWRSSAAPRAGRRSGARSPVDADVPPRD